GRSQRSRAESQALHQPQRCRQRATPGRRGGAAAAAVHAADPPVRGAHGQGVRRAPDAAGQEDGTEDRRVLPPVQRAGGDRRRHRRRVQEGHRRAGERLPLPRPLAGAGHEPAGRDGRAVRPGHRLLQGQGRVDALLRRRGRQPRRPRHRRRPHPARAGVRLRPEVQEERRRNVLPVRRRGDQPGHVQRGAEHGVAVEGARDLYGREQRRRDGHPGRAAQRRAGRGQARPRVQHAVRERRRERRRHGDRRDDQGRRPGPPRRGADVLLGQHLPVPRALDERPAEVPDEGGAGEGPAPRPDRAVRREAPRPRADQRGADRSDGGRGGGRGRAGDRPGRGRPEPAARGPVQRHPRRDLPVPAEV
ncbi:MAG: Pyruvate dehydrogenase E1 component alpha subunit, partial [uncultured Phycisphaerae bacterium]